MVPIPRSDWKKEAKLLRLHRAAQFEAEQRWMDDYVRAMVRSEERQWTNAAEQVAVVALYRFAKDGQMPKIYQDNGMQTYTFGNA